jgi:hypothetical protein
MPLISAAKLSGIISRLGAVPVLCAMRSATGIKMAVTAVDFAQNVDVRDLFQPEGLGRRRGQCDALVAVVARHDEKGCCERHDASAAHAVGRRNAAEVQLHERRLFARRQVRLPEL